MNLAVSENAPVLQVDNLTIHIRSGRQYLNIINSATFNIYEKKWINISGESGSGKSILMKAIAGLEPCHDGKILIGGIQVGGKDSSWKKKSAFAAQENCLFKKLTINENIAYIGVLNDWDFTDEQHQIKLNGLIDTFALQPWMNRIAGECGEAVYRKIQLIAALLKNPSLIIADDPWSGLDNKGKISVNTVLQDYISYGGAVLTTSIDRNDLPGQQQYQIKDGVMSC